MLKAGYVSGACEKIGPADPAAPIRNLGSRDRRKIKGSRPAIHHRFADLVFFLPSLPLAEKMGEQQTTQAPTAQHATGN